MRTQGIDDCRVTAADAVAAGMCDAGVRQWIARHLPDDCGGTIRLHRLVHLLCYTGHARRAQQMITHVRRGGRMIVRAPASRRTQRRGAGIMIKFWNACISDRMEAWLHSADQRDTDDPELARAIARTEPWHYGLFVPRTLTRAINCNPGYDGYGVIANVPLIVCDDIVNAGMHLYCIRIVVRNGKRRLALMRVTLHSAECMIDRAPAWEDMRYD